MCELTLKKMTEKITMGYIYFTLLLQFLQKMFYVPRFHLYANCNTGASGFFQICKIDDFIWL